MLPGLPDVALYANLSGKQDLVSASNPAVFVQNSRAICRVDINSLQSGAPAPGVQTVICGANKKITGWSLSMYYLLEANRVSAGCIKRHLLFTIYFYITFTHNI